jgi:receptor protein-tyrosine kinase
LELRDYLKIVRARKWLIIQAVVIVTAIAVGVSLLQAPSYEAEAKVLVTEQSTRAQYFGSILPDLSSEPERGLDTQIELMQLRPLVAGVIEDLALDDDVEDLMEHVTVSSLGQTNLVTIGVTAGDPDEAAETANALANAFVDWSRELKRESIKAARDEVEGQLAAATSPDERALLTQMIVELRISEELEGGSGSIVELAVADPEAASPSPVRNGVLGLALGLLLGLAMAFLAENLDVRIKSLEDAEAIYGAPVLGQIPFDRTARGGGGR